MDNAPTKKDVTELSIYGGDNILLTIDSVLERLSEGKISHKEAQVHINGINTAMKMIRMTMDYSKMLNHKTEIPFMEENNKPLRIKEIETGDNNEN